MISYDSILQLVNGKVYSLHNLWNSFHIHQPGFDAIRFYGVSITEKKVIVAQTDGKQFLYHDIPKALLEALDQENHTGDNLTRIISGGFRKEPCDASISEVPLADVLTAFTQMRDHIKMTDGLWATPNADQLRKQPGGETLVQIAFRIA